ncbi:hypothetical protein [Lacipirellula sp.]|uniref:hypothetical protein n=1 Tax=Lacipirellula sp. TaxID=2691419 RepID=UPI003D13EFD9
MPRPRFTLRVALALVAMLCGWLGWQASIVRERNAVLAAVRTHHGLIFYHDASELPLVRQWMGDTAADWIMISKNSPQDLQDRIKRAFPRTQLNVIAQEGIELFRPSAEQ